MSTDARKTSRRNSSVKDEVLSLESSNSVQESEKLVEQKSKAQTAEEKSKIEKVPKVGEAGRTRELRLQWSASGVESSHRSAAAEVVTKITDNEAVMIGQSTENSDALKLTVKKKGRMECAESGQLKPISATLSDNEPSASSKKFSE